MPSVFRKILYLFPLLLVSCIQDYEIEYDNQDILTLNTEFNHLEPAKVLIALPKDPDQYGDYETPSDAEVILYENGEFFEQLFFQANSGTSSGLYYSTKSLLAGNSYTIEATYSHLPTISAHQTIPELPDVSNIVLEKQYSEMNNNDTLPIQISFRQNEAASKYFAIYAYWDVEAYVTDEEGNSELQNLQPRLYIFDDGSDGFRDFERFWVKPLPASNEYNFNLSINNLDSLQTDSVVSAQMVIIVAAISEEGYLYRDSYRNKNDDNYGEPSRVYSNINDGLGVCTSRSYIIRKYAIK